jgi:hypothetical protein
MSETTAGGGTPELRPRHFEKTEGLVIRTAGDLPPEHLARRARQIGRAHV